MPWHEYEEILSANVCLVIVMGGPTPYRRVPFCCERKASPFNCKNQPVPFFCPYLCYPFVEEGLVWLM